MKIYQEETINKTNRHRKDQITSSITYFALSIFLIILGISLLKKEELWFGIICFLIAAFLGVNAYFSIHLFINRKVSHNLKFQEIIDLVNNRQILALFGENYKKTDCIDTGDEVLIGYQSHKYVYYECMIGEKFYGFAVQIIDEVYNLPDKIFEKLTNNECFDNIDVFTSNSFNANKSKEDIIKEFMHFIEDRETQSNEIERLCDEVYIEEK